MFCHDIVGRLEFRIPFVTARGWRSQTHDAEGCNSTDDYPMGKEQRFVDAGGQPDRWRNQEGGVEEHLSRW